MKRLLRHVRRRSSLRAVVATLALVNYVALAIGLPLPQPGARVASSMPYPCQHHRCGCQSAEQCWASCCCFTPQERLAWAKRHLKFVPERLAATLEVENQESARQHTCCHHAKHDDHDHNHDADDHPHGERLAQQDDHDGVGEDHQHEHGCEHGKSCGDTSHDEPQQSDVTWVVWIEAQKCKGGALTWLGVPCSVPPDAPRHVWNDSPLVAPVLLATEPYILSLRAAPPDPPPRLI